MYDAANSQKAILRVGYIVDSIVSVLHQNEGGIGKNIPDAGEIYRGQSLREITRAERMDFPFSHNQQGRIDFNTVNPSLPTRKDFPIHALSKN